MQNLIDLYIFTVWKNEDFQIFQTGAHPHVAGVAALIIGANGGSMSPSQVRAQLKNSADDLGKPGNDDFYGQGRVNAYRAVAE